MKQALFKKEWKQLRSLRYTGLGLILLLPAGLISIASGAQRSWIPLTPGSDYSITELFDSALPVCLVALWGLLALLFSSQSFAGDKGTGTEMFLLEMPVARSGVWRVKLLVTTLSILLQLAFGFAYWYFLTHILYSAPSGGWHVTGLMVLGGGLAASVICCVSGAIAAAFLQTPMHALLLGAVLAALPFGLSTIALGLFPFAAYREVSLPLVFPWVLLIGYGIGAYRITCLGEPLGGGKVRRGLFTLASALLAVVLLFVVVTPLAMRADVTRLVSPSIVASSSGNSAVVVDYQYSGIMIDVASGKRLKFLPPPIHDVKWNAEGTTAAITHQARPLGGFSEYTVVEFVDNRGRSLHTVSLDGYYLTGRSFWSGDYYVTTVGTGFSTGRGLLIISAQSGDFRLIEIELPLAAWNVLGPADDGTAYLFQVTSELPTDSPQGLYKEMIDRGVVSTLRRIDFPGAGVAPEILYEEAIVPYIIEGGLSPSGTHWLRLPMGSGSWSVLDLETFSKTEINATGMTHWLADDRLAWIEQQEAEMILRIGSFTGAPARHSWTAKNTWIVRSPDKRNLLITVPSQPMDDSEYWLYESEHDSLTEITSWFAPLVDSDQPFRLDWAGPTTIALAGKGVTAMIDIKQPGKLRWVYGEP